MQSVQKIYDTRAEVGLFVVLRVSMYRAL